MRRIALLAALLCVICGSNEGTDSEAIEGTSGDDMICGRQGADDIHGNGGNDMLSGGDGIDHVWGDAGDDIIQGDGDIDLLFGGPGNDKINGGSGNDQIDGEGGGNLLIGGTGDDTIRATNDANHDALGNVMCGGGGKDRLFGEGDGHTCLDAGSAQGTTGGVDCSYTSPLVDVQDVGTAINCRQTSGVFHPVTRGCGCP